MILKSGNLKYIYLACSRNEKETLTDIDVDGTMTYGCLFIKPRGPNILEFSIIGKLIYGFKK